MARLCGFIVAALDGDMAAADANLRDGEGDRDALSKTALLYLDWAGEAAAARRVAEGLGRRAAGQCRGPLHFSATPRRDGPPSVSPPPLVTRHFDEVADGFERKLGVLDYGGPARIPRPAGRPAWRRTPRAGRAGHRLRHRALRAPILRPFARRLAGVDLSTGMLAAAPRRGGSMTAPRDPPDLLDVLPREAGAPGT